MSDNINPQEFSEAAAVAFIKERLTEDLSARLSNDDILNVIDTAYDYYDEHGLLDFSDIDSDINEQDIAAYIVRNVHCQLTESEAIEIIRLEDRYEDSLNDF